MGVLETGQMKPAAEYEIRAVKDFLQVPEDRMDACLADFVEWVEFKRNEEALIKLLSAGTKFPEVPIAVLDIFYWVDDGIDGISRIDLLDENGETIGKLSLVDVE